MPILILHVHSSCNCRCVMCDIWKTTEGRSLRPQELTAQIPSIRKLGVEWVVFSGGEPLLNPDFPALCAMLHQERIRTTLLTTGLLLRRHARSVADSFDDVTISLDGPQDVHNAIRRVPGAYGVISEGIAAVRAIRPAISIRARTTVQSANFRFLRATVESARALGLDGISFLAADLTSEAFNRPSGWTAARQHEVALSAQDLPGLEREIESLIEQFAAEIHSGFIAESPGKLRRIVRHFRAYLGLECPRSPACNAPWVSAVIEADGSARPCFFHRSFGNIHRGDLEEAVNGESALEFRASLNVSADATCNRCVCSLNYRD
ncbi:MAG TPA: radical SAM protein [Candidatus Acidoferrales bacterium]|nr:radical SAM protein [Candidatus Acidoferrales bacterium]